MTPSERSYREIPLTQGLVALVDIDDYERINKWRWYAGWTANRSHCYATRNEAGGGLIRMHREVLGLERDDKRVVDHIDRNTLDNRRSNIRVATQSQNMQNRDKAPSNTSGFKGVHFCKGKNKFRAQIKAGGLNLHLGYRDTAEAAHRELYVPAALVLHGVFAWIQ